MNNSKNTENLSNEQKASLMIDYLSTVNPCTIADVEKCRDKDELRELIIRRQPKFE